MGYRLATSIEGTLTGRGGDIIIVDDPLKPIDALSDSRRERVNNAFVNTILSRLDDKRTGAIIIVMQRVHEDDLVGRLLRDAPAEWTVLSLPAIAEQEEAIEIGGQTTPCSPCRGFAACGARAAVGSRSLPRTNGIGRFCRSIPAVPRSARRADDQADLAAAL